LVGSNQIDTTLLLMISMSTGTLATGPA
jgi:hypothetical protein